MKNQNYKNYIFDHGTPVAISGASSVLQKISCIRLSGEASSTFCSKKEEGELPSSNTVVLGCTLDPPGELLKISMPVCAPDQLN